MKWGILAILLFLPLSAEARETKPTECSVIEGRAFGFIKCRYRPETFQWRLTYYPTAYGQVLESGKYGEMLRLLCEAYGDSIHETIHEIFRGKTREISCG